MRTQGGYRFSLQFAAETEEQIRVGEFLERMGNRKSVIVVNALSLYLDANPELSTPGAEVKVQTNAPYRKEDIEKMIRAIIEERLSGMPQVGVAKETAVTVQQVLEDDITSMLGNLSMFG